MIKLSSLRLEVFVPDLFERKRDGDIHIFVSNGTPKMDILVRSDNQTFTQMGRSNGRTHEVIINGTFNEYSSWDAAFSGGPLPVSSVTPTGPVVQNGKVIANNSGAGKYYFAYKEVGRERTYYVGTGGLPVGCTSGLGGLGGLIFLNRKHDAKNQYRSGVPAGAPVTGEPSGAYAPFLTHRGNTMYGNVESRGASVGKVAIGLTPEARIVIAVQADATTGVPLDDFRDKLTKYGIRSGVLLDCSDSACLIHKGIVIVEPAPHKNRSSAIGIGFTA
jgi:hypothetical protein